MEGWGIVEKNSTSRNYHNGQCWYFFIKTLLSYFVHKRRVGSILQTLLLFEFLLHDGLIMVLLILNIGNLGEPYRIGNVKQVYNVVSGPSHDESKRSGRTAVRRHCTGWYEIWALTDHEIYYIKIELDLRKFSNGPFSETEKGFWVIPMPGGSQCSSRLW